MSNYPAELEELIEALKQLPAIGRRSAERMAMALLKWPSDNLRTFGALLAALPEKLFSCPLCGNLTGGGTLCAICSQKSRNTAQICVVEDVAQLYVIEKSNYFKGVYHVLGGKISPLNNRTEEHLNIEKLSERIAEGGVEELIIALGSDVESRATAFFLADKFKGMISKITVPAQGLPAGANLNYADSATITMALLHRHDIE